MSGASGDRWVAVGSSCLPDSRKAGIEAAEAALAGESPRLVIVFANLRHDLPELLAGISSVADSVPLVWCSTAGEMTGVGATDNSVVVTMLGGPGFRVTTTCATGLTGRQREAGAEVAAGVQTHLDDSPIFLMLMDGLITNQEEVLRGAYSVLGAGVPMVGGCAGDSARRRRTFVLHGTQVHTDAVVGAALSSTGSFGIGVQHGLNPIGEPLVATRSKDGRVAEFDDEPALDVYLRRLGAPAEAYQDPAAFAAFSLQHPLALRRRNGYEMRYISGADFVARALICLTDVPEAGPVWLVEGESQAILDAADSACLAALDSLDGRPALGMLTFDCVARRGLLGDDGIQHEVTGLAKRAAGVPLAGFYSNGEIARTRGANGFHNHTMVVLALS